MRAQQRRAATANFQIETQEATRRHNKKLEVERITGILTSRQPGMLLQPTVPDSPKAGFVGRNRK